MPDRRVPTEAEKAFVLGQESGRIEARLDHHDERFERINGSIDAMTFAVDKLAKAVEKQGADAAVMAASIIAQKTADDRRWTIRDRLIAWGLGGGGLLVAAAALFSNH